MNKHIRAFVIIGVLAVAIIIVGVIVGKNIKPNPYLQIPAPQAQGIVGVTTSGGQITINNLVPGQTIHTPFTVTGIIAGWFFEGSFPVYMNDNLGNRIGAGIASSSQDWMTANPIPFSVTLPAVSYTGPGTLVFHNDNASGEPQNDDSYTVPVIFQ